jgi:hypothetical protein
MSIAIASLSRLLSPLWMASAPLPTQAPLQPRFAVNQRPAQAPLRVTRLAEDRLPRHLAGRMVISGRLEDVCRELERLESMGQDSAR